MGRRYFVLTAPLLVLAGCADLPVGWGSADKVLFTTADTIKIQWDNTLTNEAAVRQKAVAHCGGRGVEVVDAEADTWTFGQVRSKTWRCVPKGA